MEHNLLLMPNISLGIEHLCFHFVVTVESQHSEVLARVLIPKHGVDRTLMVVDGRGINLSNFCL